MHSPHPKLVNKVLKNILRNKSFKWWFYQQLWRVWDVIQVSLPQLHRGWQKTQGFWIRSEGLCHSWQSRQQALHIFPGSPGPRCRGAKAEAAPDASCSLSVGLGKPSLTPGLLEHLPNICPQGNIISITQWEKKQHNIQSATWAGGKCYLCLPKLFLRQTSLKRGQDKNYHKSCRNNVETCPLTTHWSQSSQSSLFIILYLGMYLLTKICL